MDVLAGQDADNRPNSAGLGVYQRTVPELLVRVYGQPGPGPEVTDRDQKSQTGSVATSISLYSSH
jgi:hypothetical protein